MNKKYKIQCYCCKKELIFDVETCKIGHKEFINKITIAKNSKCKCIKAGIDLHSLNMLARDLKYIEDNKDIIIREMEAQNDNN